MRLQNAEANSEVHVIALRRTHDENLRHVAEAFPPAKPRTHLNNHRVIGIVLKCIATNTSIC